MKDGGTGGKGPLVSLEFLSLLCRGILWGGFLMGFVNGAQAEMMRELQEFVWKEEIYFYPEISIPVGLNQPLIIYGL